MTVIHPRISYNRKVRLAANVLRSMSRLLGKRHHHEVSRKHFLSKWRKLRKELQSTPEYRDFVNEVRGRAGGVCERCGSVGKVVHHKEPVAYAVHLALEPNNGELLCSECHEDEHPWLAVA